MTESILQNKKVSVVISILLLATALLVAGYVIYSDREANQVHTEVADSLLLSELESGDVILEKIGELMILPNESNPAIIALSNIEELKAEQPFYEFANNGDYLVIYPEAKKAIIYNVERNILVNVGPIIGDESEESVEN